MFASFRVRGAAGAILWGYREIAELRGWTVSRRTPTKDAPARWMLTATFARRGAAFEFRQKGLLFTAPRDRGRWCWPIQPETIRLGDATITALLGSPEQ